MAAAAAALALMLCSALPLCVPHPHQVGVRLCCCCCFRSWHDGQLPAAYAYFSGALSGVTEGIAFAPFQVVKACTAANTVSTALHRQRADFFLHHVAYGAQPPPDVCSGLTLLYRAHSRLCVCVCVSAHITHTCLCVCVSAHIPDTCLCLRRCA